MNIRKFLGIAFMCHQMPERSFFIKGRQFPLCARCTGVLCGYFAGIAIACITNCRHSFIALFALLPMIIDGVMQYKFNIKSNNARRFVTGLLGGIGIIYLFVNIHILTVAWVREVLRLYRLITFNQWCRMIS